MATNDITGDRIKSKPANDQYRSEYERTFGKPEKEKANGSDNYGASDNSTVLDS